MYEGALLTRADSCEFSVQLFLNNNDLVDWMVDKAPSPATESKFSERSRIQMNFYGVCLNSFENNSWKPDGNESDDIRPLGLALGLGFRVYVRSGWGAT